MNIDSFNSIDYGFILVIVASVFFGYRRGLAKELLSLVIWVVALTFPLTLAGMISPFFHGVSDDPKVQTGLAVVSLFILIFVLGFVVNFLMKRVLSTVGLSGVNRFFGAVFGLMRGCVLTAVIVVLVGLTVFAAKPIWKQSALAPFFKVEAENIVSLMPFLGKYDLLDSAQSQNQAAQQAQ